MAFEASGEPGSFLSLPPAGRWLVARRLRAARRGAGSGPDIALHGGPGRLPHAAGPREGGVSAVLLGTFRRGLGLDVRVVGELASRASGRPVIFVSNHSSWIDVPVVGGVLPGSFVAKGEIGGWPVVRTIARLGRTVFVSRQRGSTARERDAMREVLARGDNLILFPEGTSSDGSRVLPFRSSFFALAEGKGTGSEPPAADPTGFGGLRPPQRPARRTVEPARLRLVWRHGHRLAFLADDAASGYAGDGVAARAARSGDVPGPQEPRAGGLANGGGRCLDAAAEPARRPLSVEPAPPDDTWRGTSLRVSR